MNKKIRKIVAILIMFTMLQGTIQIMQSQASFFDNIKKILKTRDVELSLLEDNTNMIFSETKYIETANLEEIKTYSQDETKKELITVQTNPVIVSPTIENVKRFYYYQLTSDIARNIYNKLVITTTNTATIDLNVKYNISENSLAAADELFKRKVEPYIYDALYAYAEDSGNYWWQGGIPKLEYTFNREVTNKTAIFGKLILKSNLTQYSNSEAFNNKLVQVCDSIKETDTYEIVNSINTYICKNVQYAYKADKQTPDTGGINQTAYGALMNGRCVCEGFAQLFNLMCRQKGLISICVYGYSADIDGSKAGHAWNYIYVTKENKWYAVDCSMNNDNKYDYNSYLLIGQNTIIDSKSFKTTHIPGLKICSIQTFIPSTPVLALEKYTYLSNILGDVNQDKKVDIKDILLINKHRLNKISLTDAYISAGDVNKDGNLDIKDILQINKYRLGKIKEL